MLTKEDCRKRAPRDGDVIYNTLTLLMNNTPRYGQVHTPCKHLRSHVLRLEINHCYQLRALTMLTLISQSINARCSFHANISS